MKEKKENKKTEENLVAISKKLSLPEVVDKMIDKIPPEDILGLVKEIRSYKTVAEREETKREFILNKYKDSENKINSITNIVLAQIEGKKQENKEILDKTFEVIEELLEKGITDNIDKILLTLSQLTREYIDEGTIEIVKSLQNHDKDDFITVEPIEEE